MIALFSDKTTWASIPKGMLVHTVEKCYFGEMLFATSILWVDVLEKWLFGYMVVPYIPNHTSARKGKKWNIAGYFAVKHRFHRNFCPLIL